MRGEAPYDQSQAQYSNIDQQQERDSQWDRLEQRLEHLHMQIRAKIEISEQVDQALRDVFEARRRKNDQSKVT